MKTITVILMLLSTLSMTSFSQSILPGKYNWVVETNINNKTYSIIRIYEGTELVKEVKIMRRYLDINRRKDKKKIEKIVSQTISILTVKTDSFIPVKH